MVLADLKRKIRIKTGALQRCLKDHAYYQKEEEPICDQVQHLREELVFPDGDRERELQYCEELLKENRCMIGDAARRTIVALTDLRKTLEKADLDECPLLEKANEQIAAAAAISSGLMNHLTIPDPWCT